MFRSYYIIAIASATIFFAGCQKNDIPAPNPGVPKAVYAAGYHTKNSKYYTTLWKNGEASVIDSNASAYDIFVAGADVYVTGQKNNKGIMWKNGTSTTLSADPVYGYVLASSIFASGADVHIAGFAQNGTTFQKQAIYWKNNQPLVLNAGAGTEDAYAQSVFVNGNDVYVAGYRTKTGGGMAVVLWKNGAPADIVSSATATYGNINLYISGTDVYLACYEYDSPNAEQVRLWKNGTPVAFPSSILGAVPYCLFVNGTDVYIGGFEREGNPSNTNLVAKYWKNGVAVTTGDSPNGQDIVRSIYVDGADVYAAGVIGSAVSNISPAIWKNDAVYPLTGTGSNPNGEVYSVFVK